ncbi:MAG: ABC-F family ATP-binding cassette domain-containing protein [Deltaproteobacteria bacterium]|nr:ABC-F family ATP-binding cassette domain-containing protein [Deltaproteobacteria bacterium]
MSIVTVLNLSVVFVGRELFKNINFSIEEGQRIGLVGPNGSGKTTIMRLMIGEMQPDSGEIRIAKGTRLGYLPQDIYETLSGNLLSFLIDSVPSRLRIRHEIERIEKEMRDFRTPDAQARLAARLAELHQEMIDLDVRHPVHEAEKILLGLGFGPEDFKKPVSTFSGGWKMRAALAGLLYQKPDLLLLDEPTNHLDVLSVHWLEGYLKTFKGGMVLICHDREFLNRQTERTMSFEPEGMRFYKGNYDHYLKAREEEKKNLEARAKNQEQKVKEAAKFIERFRAKSSKARQAQSKIKLLKKIELVETHRKQKAIRFSFPEVPRSGREILSIQELSKGFEANLLYHHLNLRVTKGERVAIVGPNGVGKTTLLRMVAGELTPDQGRITLGHEVSMSYYAQHLSEMLDPNKTVLEEVYQAVPHASLTFVRGVCGAFLFSGSEVEKPVGVLSGGERARVCLAKILVKPGNFMVMDEPTNHLDIISSEILIDALTSFGGTLLYVSHNQSFVNRLATKIWDIRNRIIVEYPGTLSEYFRHLEEKAENGQETAKSAQDDVEEADLGPDARGRKMLRRVKAQKRHLIASALKPIRNKLKELEERIDGLEKRKTELESILIDPEIFKDKTKGVPLLNEYGEIRKDLETLMARWEHMQGELLSATEEMGLTADP